MNTTKSRAQDFAVGAFLGFVAILAVALIIAVLSGWW